MVFNPAGDRRKWQLEQVLINPEIIDYSSRIIPAPEGCLSFPSVCQMVYGGLPLSSWGWHFFGDAVSTA